MGCASCTLGTKAVTPRGQDPSLVQDEEQEMQGLLWTPWGQDAASFWMHLTTRQRETGGPDSDTSTLKSTQGEPSKWNLPKDNALMICEPPAMHGLRHKRLRSAAGVRQMPALSLGQQSHNTFSRLSRILTPRQVYVLVIWERNHHYQHPGTSAPDVQRMASPGCLQFLNEPMVRGRCRAHSSHLPPHQGLEQHQRKVPSLSPLTPHGCWPVGQDSSASTARLNPLPPLDLWPHQAQRSPAVL